MYYYNYRAYYRRKGDDIMEFNETMKINLEFDKAQEVRDIVARVYEALKIKDALPEGNENAVSFDMYDIQIAIPKFSLSKDYSNVYVLSNDNVTLVPLSDITDLNDIANSFANNSWSAYIFADSSILPIVSLASKNVIEKLGADISPDALTQFKHQDRIHELLRAIHKA